MEAMAIVPCLLMWFLWDLFTCTINDVDVEVSGLVLLATVELIRKVPECVLHIAVDLEILGLVPHVTSLVLSTWKLLKVFLEVRSYLS